MLITGAKINNSLEINKKKDSRSSRMGYHETNRKPKTFNLNPKTYDIKNHRCGKTYYEEKLFLLENININNI